MSDGEKHIRSSSVPTIRMKSRPSFFFFYTITGEIATQTPTLLFPATLITLMPRISKHGFAAEGGKQLLAEQLCDRYRHLIVCAGSACQQSPQRNAGVLKKDSQGKKVDGAYHRYFRCRSCPKSYSVSQYIDLARTWLPHQAVSEILEDVLQEHPSAEFEHLHRLAREYQRSAPKDLSTTSVPLSPPTLITQSHVPSTAKVTSSFEIGSDDRVSATPLPLLTPVSAQSKRRRSRSPSPSPSPLPVKRHRLAGAFTATQAELPSQVLQELVNIPNRFPWPQSPVRNIPSSEPSASEKIPTPTQPLATPSVVTQSPLTLQEERRLQLEGLFQEPDVELTSDQDFADFVDLEDTADVNCADTLFLALDTTRGQPYSKEARRRIRATAQQSPGVWRFFRAAERERLQQRKQSSR